MRWTSFVKERKETIYEKNTFFNTVIHYGLGYDP